MRVLLTNDDGINSAGIQNLYETILKYDFVTELWLVAPSDNKSCCSHSMSYNVPFSLTKKSERIFAVSGTPVDCVVVALQDLMVNNKPDIVISGINEGANLDVDVFYSGTVGAAREAALAGIPAIAISQLYRGYRNIDNIRWQNNDPIFLKLLPQLMHSYQDSNLFAHRSLININLPVVDIIGVKYLPQGDHYFGNHLESNNERYVIGVGAKNLKIQSQSLSNGYVVVTPIGVDLTNYKVLDYLITQNKII